MVSAILLAVAFFLALFASVGWPAPPRPHLGWLAVAIYIAAQLVGSPIFR